MLTAAVRKPPQAQRRNRTKRGASQRCVSRKQAYAQQAGSGPLPSITSNSVPAISR